jgi:hypothetical protein
MTEKLKNKNFLIDCEKVTGIKHSKIESYYESLSKERGDSSELQESVKECIESLEKQQDECPTLLWGQVQSGKTRAFTGVIASSFDHSYQIIIVLSKNSTLLTKQTTARLTHEFQQFVVKKEVEVHDIYNFPIQSLKQNQLLNKKIFIVKKHYKNIEMLIELFKLNPKLAKSKCLIIDDEADTSTIGYRRKNKVIQLQKTMENISNLRSILHSYAFLQVTATPYSLLLQKGEIKNGNLSSKALRPFEVITLPVPESYIGGEYYFERSREKASAASHLFVPIHNSVLDTLTAKSPDDRLLDSVLTEKKLDGFKKAILCFITGVAIRRCQEIEASDEKNVTKIDELSRYAFVFHINQKKINMNFQKNLVASFLSKLKGLLVNQTDVYNIFIEHYDDLAESIEKTQQSIKISLPDVSAVMEQIYSIILSEDYNIVIVNSNNPIKNISNHEGELDLTKSCNFFIGGQTLDRGITIKNLIGFMYGRFPRSSNMDSTIQHMRMYGHRSQEDISVTRFYTSNQLFERLKEIYFIDKNLRKEFLNKIKLSDYGISETGDIIMMETSIGIRPTSEHRLLLSDINILNSHQRILPIEFEIIPATELRIHVDKITSILEGVNGYTTKHGDTFSIPLDDIKKVFSLIDSAFSSHNKKQWNSNVVLDLLESFCNSARQYEIPLYVQTGRKISRMKSNGEYQDSPDSSKTDGKVARNAAKNLPCIVLLMQEGDQQNGWSGGAFYWPVVYLPELENPVLISMK